MRIGLSALFLAAAACSEAKTEVLDGGVLPASDAETIADGGEQDSGVAECPMLTGVPRGITTAYLGVRYAAAPIGALRFKAPAPLTCEEQTREAIAFGADCPQLDDQLQPIGEEDCLFLNVWAPQTPVQVLLPVLFFIHGGGNNQGSSAQIIYDGEKLAARGNVVVTINYRLGALGFAAGDGIEANNGIRDQIAALEWVRDNITRFGGDPTRVMIFGESAGGQDVCALYVSPLARGLFARAIMESGGCAALPNATGLDATNRLIDGAGCATAADPLACLREKTPEELLAALPPSVDGLTFSDFGPIVDGTVLVAQPVLTLSQGTGANVPFIIGTNADETAAFLPASINTQAAFEQTARAFLAGAGVPAAKIDDVLAIYPLADYGGDAHKAIVALTTDWRWSCPTRTFLRAIAAAPNPPPARRYYFTHHLDPMRAPMASRAGAYHGLELFFVFGGVDGATPYNPTAEDLDLAESMQRSWSAFAASGDPNTTEDPDWPLWDNATDAHLIFDAPPIAGASVRTMQCDALEAALR